MLDELSLQSIDQDRQETLAAQGEYYPFDAKLNRGDEGPLPPMILTEIVLDTNCRINIVPMSAPGSVFFSYIGFDVLATLGTETTSPRVIPCGIVLTLLITTVLYCSTLAWEDANVHTHGLSCGCLSIHFVLCLLLLLVRELLIWVYCHISVLGKPVLFMPVAANFFAR